MLAQSACSACLALAVFATSQANGERFLKVVPAKGLAPVESVTIFQTKDDQRVEVVKATRFDKPVPLPSGGPFEVVVQPKGGIGVRVADKLTVKDGATHDLKIGELLGAIELVGDDLPRAGKVVVTDVRDPGPGEKGHVAVQTASDYRVEMLVPPGSYAVWVVPANGARATRVVDNVRVQAGRSIRAGD
jgi:hypothetical protein